MCVYIYIFLIIKIHKNFKYLCCICQTTLSATFKFRNILSSWLKKKGSCYHHVMHSLFFLSFVSGLHWVFVAALRLSLVAASGGCSLGGVHRLLIVVDFRLAWYKVISLCPHSPLYFKSLADQEVTKIQSSSKASIFCREGGGDKELV